jgi:HPt (histidine-containing phosphotransfer) domain-containing protein
MPENAIYDGAEALRRLGGDKELLAQVSALFVAESGGSCRALQAALAAGDAQVLRREAHTVKSMLSTFSFESGRHLAQRLEDLAASGRLDGAEALTGELLAAVMQLARALEQGAAAGAPKSAG